MSDLLMKVSSHRREVANLSTAHERQRGASLEQCSTIGSADPAICLLMIGEDSVKRLVDAEHIADSLESLCAIIHEAIRLQL